MMKITKTRGTKDSYSVLFIKLSLFDKTLWTINTDVVGHLSKGRSPRFAKTVSYFLRPSNENCCRVEVTGKGVNLGDGEGLQILCILHFSREAKFVSKLKDILP